MKEKIRPIYTELQGYLNQAPEAKHNGQTLYDQENLWNQYNQTIDELNRASGENYDRFKIQARVVSLNRISRQAIDVQTYRTKLAGLISRLYGQYFNDEIAPFGGMPTTVIHQSQNQTVSVQMLLDLQSKIDTKLNSVADQSPEKSFLTKVKDSLGQVSSIADALNLILQTANSVGLDITQLHNLFK